MNHSRLTRRRCLRQLIAGGAAACLVGTNLCAAEPFALRFSLASSLYGKLPLDVVLPEVAATGCDSIDLWPQRHGNQREQVEEMGRDAFRQLLEMHNVRLGMTTRYDLGPFQLRDEAQFLREFGGKLIVCGAPRIGRDAPLKQAVRDFVERLRPEVDVAAEAGVSIAIENHANALLESPEALRWFVEFAKQPQLGIALAPYHLPQDPQLLAGLIRDLGPKLLHFYAWQHGHGSKQPLPKEQELTQLPGRGPLDFAPLLRALCEIRFSGWTQVFMHPYPRGVPILDDVVEIRNTLNTSRDWLTKQTDAIVQEGLS